MAISELITSPSDALKRSAHPSISTPLARADGLVIRLAPRGRSVTPSQLLTLSDLLCAAGGATISITAQGEFEISQLNADLYPVLASALPRVLDIQSGFIIDHSPIMGDDPTEHSATKTLVAALSDRLGPLASRLGKQVRVVVDGGGALDLSPLGADVRITFFEGNQWSLSFGGSKAEIVDYDTALSASTALISALAALGPEARAEDLFVDYTGATTPFAGLRLGEIKLSSGATFPIGVPEDGLSNDRFTQLARAAISAGIPRIRLAPSSLMLIDNANAGFIAEADQLGFATTTTIPFSRAAQKLNWVLDDVQTLEYRGQTPEHFLTYVTPGGRLLVAVYNPYDAQQIAAQLTTAGYGRSIFTVIENADTKCETMRTQMAEFFHWTDIGADAICAISVDAIAQGLPTSSKTDGPWG
jgi:precorrin-3B synthase